MPGPSSSEGKGYINKIDFNRLAIETAAYQEFVMPVAIKMCDFDLFEMSLLL